MKPTLEELTQYVDGEVSPARRSQLDLLREQDSELNRTVTALETSRLPIRRAYNLGQYPPLPEALKTQARGWIQLASGSSHAKPLSFWTRMGFSACLAAAVLVGYLVAQPPIPRSTTVNLAVQEAGSGSIVDWAEVIASYQSLYVRETVEHLERTDNAKKTVETTSTILQQTRVKIPDLSHHGFHFVRAQRLGYKQKPLFQLVYLADDGVPLALCFMPDVADPRTLTQFDFDKLNTGYWREAGHRFVIVGDIDNHLMSMLYQSSREQML